MILAGARSEAPPPPPPCQQPGIPIVTVSTNTNNFVRAGWLPGQGGAPTSYTISVGRTLGGDDVLPTQNVGLSTSGSGRLANGVYFLRVTASNQSGQRSVDFRFLVGGGCEALPPLTGLTSFISGSVVTLRWSEVPGATNYQLEAFVGSQSVGVVNVGNATTISRTVSPGTYRVEANAASDCFDGPPATVFFTII